MRVAVMAAALAVVVMLGLCPAYATAQCNNTALENCPKVVLKDDASNTTYNCDSFFKFEICAKTADCGACKKGELISTSVRTVCWAHARKKIGGGRGGVTRFGGPIPRKKETSCLACP
jgi:hypothetical protein